MGKKDILLNDFMSNPHIFADLINGCCFHGKRVIRPEELLPLDSVQPTKSNQGVYSKQLRDDQEAALLPGAVPPYWPWRTRNTGISYAGTLYALRCG